jgi:hypothetical protein
MYDILRSSFLAHSRRTETFLNGEHHIPFDANTGVQHNRRSHRYTFPNWTLINTIPLGGRASETRCEKVGQFTRPQPRLEFPHPETRALPQETQHPSNRPFIRLTSTLFHSLNRRVAVRSNGARGFDPDCSAMLLPVRIHG